MQHVFFVSLREKKNTKIVINNILQADLGYLEC